MRAITALALSLGVVSATSLAHAIQQPDGTTIPTAPGCANGKPSGLLATFACACTQPGVCNIGAPCASSGGPCDDGKHGTCESTMWHAFNDNTCIPSKSSGLDPVAEASVTPETFRPTCALTFTVVTRGSAIFRNVFGWYNVTSGAPDPSDLHPVLGCGAGAGASAVLDIQHEAAYRGGEIGFFLMTPEGRPGTRTCAAGDCCPSTQRLGQGAGYVYYSERKYNPDVVGAHSFIHLLIFDSHIVKRKFYFAWEDLFQGGGTGGDDEFTDLVTSVEGIECSGGGVPCDTGKQGVCARGVTKCEGGTLACEPVAHAGVETCNGLDDDCNGAIDDGAVCPVAGDICQNGKCVHRCGSAEFQCTGATACDATTGACVEPACVGVACGAKKVCRGGACVAACEGVVCPAGQTCVGRSCVDPCEGVSCAAGQVCKDGLCFAGCNACDGLLCMAPLTCDAHTGACADRSCAQPCPPGSVCSAGKCVDACTGVRCPDGEVCEAGRCGPPIAAPDGGSPGLVQPDGGGADAGATPTDDAWGRAPRAGCACDAGPDGGPGGGLAACVGAILATVAGLVRRRR